MRRYRPFKRISWILGLLLVSVGIFHGCTFKFPGHSQLSKIYVFNQVEPLFMLPQYVAIQQGYFAENGINLVECDEILKDELCLCLTDTAHLLQRNASDIIFTQLARSDLILVGRKTTADFTWRELKDASLIMNKNSWQGRLGELAFRKQGLQPNRDFTQLYNIPLQLSSSAFISGTGDYLVTNLFEGRLLEEKEAGVILACFNEIAGETLGAGYTTDTTNLTQHRKLLQNFVNAIYKGQLWMKKHSNQEIAQLVKNNYPEWPKDTLLTTISEYRQREIFLPNPIVDASIIKTTNELSTQRGNKNFLRKQNLNQQLAKAAVRTVVLEESKEEKK